MSFMRPDIVTGPDGNGIEADWHVLDLLEQVRDTPKGREFVADRLPLVQRHIKHWRKLAKRVGPRLAAFYNRECDDMQKRLEALQ
jgi:hypothetical protein